MEEQEQQLILCPYCGNTQSVPERCEICGGLFEPLSRKATQISMGPWYLRDKNLPFLPGCSYDILLRHIRAGRIKPTTIMRGPTTHQFWAIARNVPGVAHLLGYCHQCNTRVEPNTPQCPSCGATFESIRQRNELGLIYPDDKSVTVAQMRLEYEQAQRTGRFPSPVPPPAPAGASAGTAGERAPTSAAGGPGAASRHKPERSASPSSGGPGAVGLDLLEEVLGAPLPPAGASPASTGPTAPPGMTPGRAVGTAGPMAPRTPSGPAPSRVGAPAAISAPQTNVAPRAPVSLTPPPLPSAPAAAAPGSPLLDFSTEASVTAPAPPVSAESAPPAAATVPAPLELDDGGKRITTTFWLVAGGTFMAIVVIALLVFYMLSHPGT